MELSIFGFIKRYSWKEQLIILGMTLASFPLLYMLLDLPKTIVNKALSNAKGPYVLAGYEFTQINYLFVLCGIFLALVLVSGWLKYVLNVYAGIVAERMLRRLRYALYSEVMRFPLPHLKRVSQGELVQLINAEVEPLGGYVGDALAVPAFQGGTLITTLIFIFAQDPVLGFAAIALYPIQMYLIPKLQARVNALGKLRVRQVRKNAERISEMATWVRDIRANDTTAYERSRFSEDLWSVFDIRFEIYKKKFMIKFINNFMAQLGPFFFFAIGGYLVIQGSITLGALVAILGAHKDLAAPWRELLTYYQTTYDVKIKYEQTVMQFAPAGMRDLALQTEEPAELPHLTGELRAVNLTVRDEADEPVLDGASFAVKLPASVAIVGPAGSGKEELSLVIAGLIEPQGGRVSYGDLDITRLPEAVTGRRISYVANPTGIFVGSIAENLFYGLKHRPHREPDITAEAAARHARARMEAVRSGNSVHDFYADWIDYASAGITDQSELRDAVVRVLHLIHLDNDVYFMGLRGTIRADEYGDLDTELLGARQLMQERLAADERLSRLVERFDSERYNGNASMAENLLFGTPVGEAFDPDRLASNPYVLETLEKTELLEELRVVGYKVATTMVELFADLPPDHEYFRQFSFIEPDDLPYYRALMARADPAQLAQLPAEDRERLLDLPFKLISSRHRLGLITPELETKILAARQYFREHLPEKYVGKIAFFDAERYNEATSVQDNILFGKIAFGQAQAAQRISELIIDVLQTLGLRERIIEVGLKFECGINGGRLSQPQRQKLALARAILKRPEIVILHDATSGLDAAEQAQIRDNLIEEFQGRSLIWALQSHDWARYFEQVIVLDKGRVVAQGSFEQVDQDGAPWRQMMAAQ